MNSPMLMNWNQRTRELLPGFVVSLIVAAAASFLSEHYGAPVMLFALLLGMGLNFLSSEVLLHKGLKGRATLIEPNLSGNLGVRTT